MASFSANLLTWYDLNKRDLPWRRSGDAYCIWVSEIMLQQTRVDQTVPYYQRFLKRFPDVYQLAEADLHDVLLVWEGLGYYSRARNLHRAAQIIVEKYHGKIPENRNQLLELPGIGAYTAAAVSSIAYSKPCVVVDGNVIRVIARFSEIRSDVRSASARKAIEQIAGEYMDKNRPGDFNQALMELGATVCKPQNPLCDQCPLQSGCKACRLVKTDEIPYKSPARKTPHHRIAVGILYDKKGRVFIARRPETAMLGGLWEFPGGKIENGEDPDQAVIRELKEELGVDVKIEGFLTELKHAYSHFSITLMAFQCSIISGRPASRNGEQYCWAHVDELESYPFPRANRKLTERLITGKYRKLIADA